MTYILGAKSLQRLNGVHPDLVKVVNRAIAISTLDFTVIEGIRSLEKQREYFNAGKSRTMRSRHLTGHAVDLAPYLDTDGDGDKEISWTPSHFKPIAMAMKQAAKDCGVYIEWGGDWATFVDMPHFQLPWSKYP